MLSFEICSAEDLRFLKRLKDEELDYALEILESFSEGCAFAYEAGCIFARINDGGEYYFVYPIPLCEGADGEEALTLLSAYVRREMLPFRLCDVPREELGLVTRLFPHISAAAYEEDEDSFFVRIKNECDLLAQAPTVTEGEITLSPLTDGDTAAYARLCRDGVVNEHWGYDYRNDKPNAEDGYFLSVARGELSSGVAITLAVRAGGCFVGEAVLYDFDFQGSAELGVRLLPEFWGRGLGKGAVLALVSLAKKIGLKALRASVKKENIRSLCLMEQVMVKGEEKHGVVQYGITLK